MEEGVIRQIRQSRLAEFFDDSQYIISNSGSGNNWSVGHRVYGAEYGETILESLRKQAEYCDSLQSFFVIKSMGGGTGSGLGSYIIEMLADEFPDVYRFVTTVCPSGDDHVVTSPYNSLIESADCVIPIENQALLDIHDRIVLQNSSERKRGSALSESSTVEFKELFKPKPFDSMNNIVANLLMNMTSSMRFEGTMNVDIGDIATNLVPFPRLKFLVSSMTPLYSLTNVKIPPRRLDQMFTDAFSKESQLIKADSRSNLCEIKSWGACALILRGDVEISDIRRNIDKFRSTMRFASWNLEAWKTGICSVPPLVNRSMISKFFQANLHHYLDNMDVDDFINARDRVKDLLFEYQSMDQ
ncbi:Tubulin epsilon chain [Nowakowskiella sp. JEL0078]|nr:Tubulin epsilon chain [Nowakowskiella sp. JEL0078]